MGQGFEQRHLSSLVQAPHKNPCPQCFRHGSAIHLSRLLYNAPTTHDDLEKDCMDSSVSMLEETSAKLTKLRRRSLASSTVAQAIAGCNSKINDCLLDCSLSHQMQNNTQVPAIQRTQQEDHQNLLMIRQSQTIHVQSLVGVGPTGTQLTATVAGCVTLIDATGYEHPISVNFCTSYQQLTEMLQVLFKHDSAEARIQRRYLEKGQYDLCIDKGTQVALTNMPSIEAGTKIVMRVVFEQQNILGSEVDYECHFCGAVNHLPTGSISYSLQRQAGCSIDCRACKRRFHISRRLPSAEWSTKSSNIDSYDTTDAEMRLIRNFHVQQTCVILSFEDLD
ncbi:hypothetical protein DFH29DRAFT_444336 [Suillus ampliporus]|nr:hypothetical protein DFH29DRAFT_444336 [Suillus ampliporus]